MKRQRRKFVQMVNPIILYDSLDEFLKNFDKNFELFQRMYKHSTLNDFLDEYELKINSKIDYFNNSPAERFKISTYDSGMNTRRNPHKEKLALKAIKRDIQDKRILSPLAQIDDKNYLNNVIPIQWKGTPTELTALIKSLKESNKLEDILSEKQIVERFEKFFIYPLKGYDQTKSKIRKRTKDYTPFIDKLKNNLEIWIKKKD